MPGRTAPSLLAEQITPSNSPLTKSSSLFTLARRHIASLLVFDHTLSRESRVAGIDNLKTMLRGSDYENATLDERAFCDAEALGSEPLTRLVIP